VSSQRISISKLQLTNFRNYKSSNFTFDHKIIAIAGNNGVGKTNILESISLLGKIQGLKSAEFSEIVNNDISSNNFTIYGEIKNHPDIDNVGVSYSKTESKKTFHINNKPAKGKNFPTIIWLTPQMDSLFYSSKTLRRKFLDKIVCDINPQHSTTINSYNQAVKERMRILTKIDVETHNRNQWLDIIERKIAELGTAIASSRNEAMHYLNDALIRIGNNFTKTQISLIGEIENYALFKKALEVEEIFLQKLKNNRGLDSKIGRTMFGVHRSDFTATLLEKNIEAKHCSTGEQKSILIAITFARVGLSSMLNLPSAILLLDEIVSHLDDKKREELLREILKINCQSFLTATNKSFFNTLEKDGKNTLVLEI
jgi:DNA replication and repair protein RecF